MLQCQNVNQYVDKEVVVVERGMDCNTEALVLYAFEYTIQGFSLCFLEHWVCF